MRSPVHGQGHASRTRGGTPRTAARRGRLSARPDGADGESPSAERADGSGLRVGRREPATHTRPQPHALLLYRVCTQT